MSSSTSTPTQKSPFSYLFTESSHSGSKNHSDILESSPRTFLFFKPVLYRHFATKTQESLEEKSKHPGSGYKTFLPTFYKTVIARPLYMQLRQCLENKFLWEDSTEEIHSISKRISDMWHHRRTAPPAGHEAATSEKAPHATAARTINDAKVMDTPCMVEMIDYRGATMDQVNEETIRNYTSVKECLHESLLGQSTNVFQNARNTPAANAEENALLHSAEDSTSMKWITGACKEQIEKFQRQESKSYKHKVDLLSSLIDRMEPLHTTPQCQGFLDRKYSAYIHHGVLSGEFTEASNKYFACEMQHQMPTEWNRYDRCFEANRKNIEAQTDEDAIEYCKDEIFHVFDSYLDHEDKRIAAYESALKQEEGRLF